MKYQRLSLALACATALAACGSAKEPAPDATKSAAAVKAVPVQLVKPVLLANTQSVRANGRLEAADEMRLSFLTTGVIAELTVDIGDRVRKGQVLGHLESTDLDATAVVAARAAEHARNEYQRAEGLWKDRYVSRSFVDAARTADAVANEALRSARHAQRYSRIVAPGDGVVLARLSKPGEIVASGQQVLAVSGDASAWLVRIDLPDRDFARLAVDALAEVQFDAVPGQTFAARVSRIAGAANATTGMLAAELRLRKGNSQLRSGMIARATITVSDDQRAVAIPLGALIDAEGERGSVFVAHDGRAVRSDVLIGTIQDGMVSILAGIDGDASVVVAGASYVTDGAALRVAEF